MPSEGSRVIALLVVGSVLLGSLGAGFAGAQSGTESPLDPADEIYVTDDGEAVLVYESTPSDAGPKRTEFGVDVAENLAYLLVTDPVETEPDVRGHLTVGATRTSLRGEGDLSFPRPDALEAFELEVESESTADTSRSDVSLAATLRDESGFTGLIHSAETSGTVTTTGDGLTASGSLDVRSNVPLGAANSFDATLSETDSGYTLTVDRSGPVPNALADRWANRSSAKRLLRIQYEGMARLFDGSATINLQEHAVTETDGRTRIDQAYTVRFTGIDEGIESMVREQLSGNPDLSGEEAGRMASQLTEVRIDEARLSYEVDGRDLTGEFSLDVSNYDDFALAYVEIAQATNPRATTGAAIERARAQFEAQDAADLEQRFTWNASLDHPESETVRAEVEAKSRSTNWSAYADELERRDLPFFESSAHLTGGIDGDRVQFSGEASMEGEGLHRELLRAMPDEAQLSPQAVAILDGLRESKPQKAKLTAAYDEDGLRIEAGAEFSTLAAVRDALHENVGVPPISEAVGRSDDAESTVVLRVEDAVGAQPTDADVRALSFVDEDTVVHLPGEWDREFPRMDVDRAEDFLSDVLPSTGSSGPGFGPVVAVAALLAAGGLLARHR